MVRSRCSLWMRGAGFCAALVLGAGLTGCLMEASEADIKAEIEAEEDVAEAEEMLRLGSVEGTPVTRPLDDRQDPDPEPWHPKLAPEPTSGDTDFRVRTVSPATSGSSNDKK